MSEYSVKIFLILFSCSGLLSLIAGVYLKVRKTKRSRDPKRVRTLARKYLWRGVSSVTLSLVAYASVTKGMFAPWLILIMLVALLPCIEFLIARAMHLNIPVKER